MNNKTIVLSLFISFLITGFKGQSQVMISGEVINKQTADPISYVHIYNKKLGIGTTTNLNGEFNLKCSDTLDFVQLIFSHVGYEVYTLDFEITANATISISLTPNSILLDEIAVSPKDAFELIKKCVQHSSLNYSTDGFNATGFQREVIKNQDEYVQLVEAEYKTYHVQGKTTSSIINGRFAENKAFRIRDKLWNDKRGGFYVFGITSLGGDNLPFERSVFGVDLKDIDQLPNYYNLDYEGTIELATGEAFRILFYPKKGSKKSLIEGTIYIDSDTYALVELDYKISENGKKYIKTNRSWDGKEISTSPSSKKVNILDESCQIKYRLFNEKWYLSSIVQDVKFTVAVKLPLKTIAKSSLLDLHLEQIVSDINSEKANALQDSIPTEMYYYQVYLKNKHENYDSEQWNQFKSIKDHIDYSIVVEDLKKKNKEIR